MNIAAVDSSNCFFRMLHPSPRADDSNIEKRHNSGSTISRRRPCRCLRLSTQYARLGIPGTFACTRTLYCGKSQFYWQCSEAVHSEDGYIDHNMPLNVPGERQSAETRESRWVGPTEASWHSWVSDFSKRFFTKPTDRLPALYGVIKRHISETGKTPMLGLWKESLVKDLAWRTRHVDFNILSVFPLEKSTIPNIPSWTWLYLHCDSYEGGVVYFPPMAHETDEAKVVEIRVDWDAEPFMSKISGTKLVLEGPLALISLEYDGIRRRLHPEGGEERPDMDRYVIRTDETITEKGWDSSKEIREYWCVLLHSSYENLGDFIKNENESGARKDSQLGPGISTFLVLEEVDEDSVLRRFRRLGCGRVTVCMKSMCPHMRSSFEADLEMSTCAFHLCFGVHITISRW
jgi:hypothetical protein